MKAMIWKELRENSKWAVLGGVGLALVMAWALWGSASNWRPTSTVLEEIFLSVTVSFFPALAVMLGFAQIINESWRDHWSFLLHRPISPTRLFFGKVIAGLMLYFMATGVPLLLLGVWSSWPGRFAAPFDWAMMQAGLADMLTGTAYYFAAMITAQRQARWYGSRGLSLGAAVCLSAWVVSAQEFWHALLAIAGIDFILCAAAWGGFCTAGVWSAQPRRAKAALGLASVTGICLVGGFVLAIVIAIVARDDTLVRYITTPRRIEQVTGLQGRAIEALGLGVSMTQCRPEDFLHQQRGVLIGLDARRAFSYWNRYRSASRWFVPMNRSTNRGENPNWYFDTKQQVVLGYNIETKRLAWRAGADGFLRAADDALPRPFGDWINPEPYLSLQQRIICPDAIYEIDFDNRVVSLIFRARDDETIIDAVTLSPITLSPEVIKPTPINVIGTSKRLLWRRLGARSWREVVHEYDPKQYPMVTIMIAHEVGRTFLRYSAIAGRPAHGRAQNILVELDEQNRVIYRVDLPRVASTSSNVVHKAMAPLTPVALWVVAWANGFPGYDAVHINLMMAASALLCAVVNHYLARRYRFPRPAMWWWTLWGFLFGPAGVVLMFCLPERQASVSCASCGRKRRVDRDQCEHCAAGFPDPPRDGTEIFESADLRVQIAD
jgi:hypothetical protein